MNHLEQMTAFYEREGLEELRLQEGSVQYLEFLTATKALDRYLRSGAKVLDSCAGSGAYAFYLAEKGHRVTAGDLVPYNVEVMRQKDGTGKLEEIYEGNALDLTRFAAGSFDAVLCMGALYHLEDPADRKKALFESMRVLKKDGLLFCTYMNRHGVILNNMQGDLETIEEVLSFAEEGKEGIFYASTPEEMVDLAAVCGLMPVHHMALDGISLFLSHTAGLLSKEGVRRYWEYHWETCGTPSLLGYGYHNLLLLKK